MPCVITRSIYLREGSKDLGATTLEGSRNGMAMMVYSSLHILGRRGYELLINQSIDKAKQFAKMIDEHPDFELVTAPTLSILTYRVCPQSVQQKLRSLTATKAQRLNGKVDRLVVNVQKLQREAGKSFVSRTRLESPEYGAYPITVFRVVLANPLTTTADLQSILKEQHDIAMRNKVWQDIVPVEAYLEKVVNH